jgi:hypothetical protein
MWVLDPQRKASVPGAQLYLTPAEARELRDALDELLGDPEALEHAHLGDSAEFSISIVTKAKLASGRYSSVERQVLGAQ